MLAAGACPELAVIVPVLNESAAVGPFVEALAEQREVRFELIFADGGSSDDTLKNISRLAGRFDFPIILRSSAAGRSRQLNTAAQGVQAPWLLFLHVDSRFPDPLALRRGIDALGAAIEAQGHQGVAGHFALRFYDHEGRAPFAYYYYETKARLDRPECTHGDQGFLLARRYFAEVGPFDETLPIMEDTRLAERIRQRGRWLLLPAEVETSSRRFVTEGLLARQVLNALIMNFAAIGWSEFFREAAAIYRRQDQARGLDLLPFLDKIRELLRAKGVAERLQLWWRTGGYVRRHGWQLALAWDAWRSFRRYIPPAQGPLAVLRVFDRWFDRLTDNPAGHLGATLLVWCWFNALWLLLRLRRAQR
ncbi:glycosyl transferase [Desulfuromonas versatilis]|uniref:Glycosyl transferase n=1 Tax=Desulfuromonas versatilis TaxID=2802975 RepID=A0ABM8HT39_9BACT|nr:TIGR04283 family arsenosugar biosynthesis glycosyltransferase [Desulfuromonas versatilis]BCR05476.1 glycosyl transferase [Desulfuromonas versatilis]